MTTLLVDRRGRERKERENERKIKESIVFGLQKGIEGNEDFLVGPMYYSLIFLISFQFGRK